MTAPVMETGREIWLDYEADVSLLASMTRFPFCDVIYQQGDGVISIEPVLKR